jgi:hypothetical protein
MLIGIPSFFMHCFSFVLRVISFKGLLSQWAGVILCLPWHNFVKFQSILIRWLRLTELFSATSYFSELVLSTAAVISISVGCTVFALVVLSSSAGACYRRRQAKLDAKRGKIDLSKKWIICTYIVFFIFASLFWFLLSVPLLALANKTFY